MSKISFISVLILFIAYSSTNGQSTHYFDKYIEGVFKTIESPPTECLKLLEESDESKMLASKDLLMCYTLIENRIPQQLKFDILNHSPHEDRRAEEIKNEAIFGTCYRKDPSSKYYDPLYAELVVKFNKTDQDEIYLASLNSHCSNIHWMHFDTDHILKEIKMQKKTRRRGTFRTIGGLTSIYISVVILVTIYNINFNWS